MIIFLLVGLVLGALFAPQLIEYAGMLRDHLRGRRYGRSMWTKTGREFWPLDPLTEDVDVHDVARGLATECRYGGHVRWYYSVAEHSVLVSIEAARRAAELGWSLPDVRLAALYGMVHDGSEAYVGDVVRPLKYTRAMRGYRRAEARVQRVVERALVGDVPRHVRDLVTQVDNDILVDEVLLLAHPTARVYYLRACERAGWRGFDAEITFRSPELAERQWLQRWDALDRLGRVA